MRALDETMAIIITSGSSEADKTRNRYLIQIEIQREIDQKLNTSDYFSEFNNSVDLTT